MLVAGEAFRWRPWQAATRNEDSGNWRALVNSMGQWEVSKEAWGLLELVWPKPGMYTFLLKCVIFRKEEFVCALFLYISGQILVITNYSSSHLQIF